MGEDPARFVIYVGIAMLIVICIGAYKLWF